MEMIKHKIDSHLDRLPIQLQAEVLNFVEYLVFKSEQYSTSQEVSDWAMLSLNIAPRSMENQATPFSNLNNLLASQPKKRRSILELRGLGKHLWQDVSVKDYINEERDSWNG